MIPIVMLYTITNSFSFCPRYQWQNRVRNQTIRTLHYYIPFAKWRSFNSSIL